VSFAGSAIAFIKLQELITGRPITYPGQQVINGIVGVIIVALVFAILVTSSTALLWVLLGFSLVLGVIFVLPIGGADVPVLISLLNSFTGVAVAASGFTLNNNLLIVAGTLVGASGMLLTRHDELGDGPLAPEHPLQRLRLGGDRLGGDRRRHRALGALGHRRRHRRPARLFEESRHHPRLRPGGRPAQHVAKELADTLTAKGVEVFYAIHPVAGRMPGHMNVLLAEANVPYEQLKEMDEANPSSPPPTSPSCRGQRHGQPRGAQLAREPHLPACRSQCRPGDQRRVLEALDAPGASPDRQ